MQLVHPNAQAVKLLRVALASKEADFPGFIGLEARPHHVNETDGVPRFFLSSSTGNLRRDPDGALLGDELVCMYPRDVLKDASLPSLNFALADVPYSIPPDDKST